MLKPVLRQLNAHALAARFMQELRAEIGEDKFLAACCKNIGIAPGLCASHDFCDANMVMEETWRRTFGRFDSRNDWHREMWNEAWRLATQCMAEIGKVQ